MNWLNRIFRRRSLYNDLAEEMREHLEERTEQFMREGLPRKEAEEAARRAFGNTTLLEERSRETWQWPTLESIWADIKYALRQLVCSPGFALAAILTLTLGIGANTAVFSLVQGVLLAPLPYAQPDRLVMVWESNPRFAHVAVSYPNFRDWQRAARSFERMAALRWNSYDLTNPGTPEHLDGMEISSGFFSTLGVKLGLGREFSPQEDQHGGAPSVILSNHLWRSRFNADREVLGKSVTLNGVDYTVTGVAPPGFRLFDKVDVFAPLGQSDPLIINNRAAHDAMVSIARLKPGASLSHAQAEIGAIQKGLDRLYPEADRDIGTDIDSLKQEIVGDTGGTLLLLLGAVGFVLLIACANVASLLLARSAARTREFAIRSALGANRIRIVRQLLIESVLLALAGGILGLAAAKWGVHLLLAALPGTLPLTGRIGVNVSVLFFAFCISLVVGILFGLAPALKSSSVDMQSSLKEGGGRGSTYAHHRGQSALVVVQMAMTGVLLIGSGLLFRAIHRIWEANPGFDMQHVITFKVGVSPALTSTASATRAAYRQLLDRIQQIPGVQAADFTGLVPLSGSDFDAPFWIGSRKPESLQAAPRLLMFDTGPDYLRTMGIPLLQGRFFTPQDTTHSPCVVVIDTVFERMYFPGTNPLGQTITFGFASMGPCQIVGVVGHVRHWRVGDPDTYTQNEAYFPLFQDPDRWVPINYADTTLLVRTPLDPAVVMPAIKEAVYGVDSGQPVYDVRTMQQIVSESMSSQRFPMILLGVFAALALVLAAVGIYGVISYAVTQRVQEIGVRMALGAEKRQVFQMIIGQGLKLAIPGLAIGVIAALILTRLLSNFSRLLYGVSTGDPITFGAVSLLLIGVAVLACYIPARRAASISPTQALRAE
jgi:predicted permease